MAGTTSSKPLIFLTVNSTPEKAYAAATRLTTELKDVVTIKHVGNIDSIAETQAKISEFKPDFLICAPVWTAEESNAIKGSAQSVKPDLKVHVIPPELGEKGGDAIMTHLVDSMPPLLLH